MTREEAVDAVYRQARATQAALKAPGLISNSGLKHLAEVQVDALQALGMLKCDPPWSTEDKMDRALAALGPAATHVELRYVLEAQGLKIVPK